MKEKVEYYAQLLEPYRNKYGSYIPITKKIKVESKFNEHIKSFYESFGKDASQESVIYHFGGYSWRTKPANYPNDFTELDYVKKHKEVIIEYGHGSAEFESVPCKLFKKTTITNEIIEEL